MTTTLLRGGRVLTPTGEPATAVLLDGETILWVGTEDAGLPVGAPGAVVDLHGALVTPAFVDGHVHSTGTGLALSGLDLAAAASLGDALDRVAAFARSRPGQVVLGTGWDDTRWPERRPPTAAELDRAGSGALVYLARVDVHSAVASTSLLAAAPEAAGMSGFDAGGQVRLDAHHAVRAAAHAAVPPGQFTQAQRVARAHAAGLGIGCVHEMAGPTVSSVADVVSLRELAATEPGPDVVVYWGELGAVGVTTAGELGAVGAGGDLFCDGSLGSHTAALRDPYVDGPRGTGTLRYDVDEIAEHLVACTRAGIQGGFHAIGDRACAAVLGGARAAAARVGGELFAARRHRVEHAEMPVDPAGFAALGMTASVQPAFDAAWGGASGMYAARLGEERAVGLNPFAAFAAAGVLLAFGSDSPVTPLDPWGGVRAAVHHRSEGSGVSPAVAFAAATRSGHLAAGGGAGGAGLLVAGAPATLSVWDTGEFPAGSGGLPDLSVGAPLPDCVRTVVRGATVFEREA